jgi:lysophospholipid acyltransferase (LPLAT)-like uncharacterized protein
MKSKRGKRLRIAIFGALARGLYGLVRRTIRPVIPNDAGELLEAFDRNERIVLAFWHGQLAMLQAAYRGRGAGICIQVSNSSDGEIIARAIRPHGIRAARGSASRGALASVREMVEARREGYDLAMAPDGPRGPLHRAKPGAIRLAQSTGGRLFPVAAAAERRLVFRRSWDQFTVPVPFSRVHYAVGDPISVPHEADAAAIEEMRAALERELDRLTASVEQRARGR